MRPYLIDLFGTDQPQPDRRTFRAGPLSAVLEEGNLRDIRYGGVEVLRAINYLARDTSWGTYAARLSALTIAETPVRFDVGFDATCEGPEGRLDYHMHIAGNADGTLILQAAATAMTDFPTNRVGFVVLHPSDAAGSPLTVRHADGTVTRTTFPDLIDPMPPALDIAALTHHPAPGMTAQLDLTGDDYEMEDQRNWADASFKTFVRPLSKPRPFVIAKGTVDRQSVTLRMQGSVPVSSGASAAEPRLGLGRLSGLMPDMALFCDTEASVMGDPAILGRGIATHLLARWKPGDTHAHLVGAAALADNLDARMAVEAILPARAPDLEAAELRAALVATGLDACPVLIAPAREFRTSPAGSLPKGEVSVDALVAAVRGSGHRGPVGAGTPSYFPEFNRNPPGPPADFAYFGGSAVIHAADDASVVETLGVLPAILATARARTRGLPVWLGPMTLAMRHTPYGAGVIPNPDGRRMPVAATDPRHFALFGAAYAAGLAAMSDASVSLLMLAAPFGSFGLIRPDGTTSALHAVQAVLAAAAGSPRIGVQVTGGLQAIAWQGKRSPMALVANLRAVTQSVALPAGAISARIATVDGRWEAVPMADGRLELAAYRTYLAHFG